MNQLDYQTGFPPGSFFHNQALPQAYGPAGAAGQNAPHLQQQQQQQQQPGQPQLRQQQQVQPQQQFQAHLQQSQQDGMYSAAAQSAAQFSQPIQTGAISPAGQQLRQSASPHQPNSPFAAGTLQQPQTRYPMAAPPLPHTPINTQQFSGVAPSSAPSTPQSPQSQALEQQRIKLVLEINADLLEGICILQEQDKGGATNPQHLQQLRMENKSEKVASEEYIQAMRRVQSNLTYLAARGNQKADSQKQQQQLPGPAHMTPPPQMPQLQSKYDRLKELFIGWAGLDGMQRQQQQQQQAQAQRNAYGGGMMPGNMNGGPA